MMTVLLIFAGIFNPSLSLNMLAPDEYTDDYFYNIHQLEVVNDFYKENFSAGIYLDYFYKSSYQLSDPYFIRSGLPTKINALGTGLQAKIQAIKNIEFFFNYGYYKGKVSYPVLGDSGRVLEGNDDRSSFGFGFGVNLAHDFGRIKGGLRIFTNLIQFGAKSPPYYYWESARSMEYISLNTAGFGLLIGVSSRRGDE